MISCKCNQNPLGNFQNNFLNFIGPRDLSRDHNWRGGIQEILDFQGFRNISKRVFDISS